MVLEHGGIYRTPAATKSVIFTVALDAEAGAGSITGLLNRHLRATVGADAAEFRIGRGGR